MTSRRQFHKAALSLTGLGGLGVLCTTDALAQALDQVKIFYGFPAGSAGDGVARRVGEKLAGSAYTKNTGVVENKPGPGGRIALDSLKSSPADGSALALSPWSALAIYPHIYSKLSYDPVKDSCPCPSLPSCITASRSARWFRPA